MRVVVAAVAVGLALALVAVACRPDSSATPAATGEPDDGGLDGTWVLASGTHGGADIPMPEGATIDLTFDGSTAGGTAACNSWFGEVAFGERSISFSGLGQTEMACEDERMAAETAYLQALASVAAWELDGGELTLSGPGVEMVFTRQPAVEDSELVGTAWTLDTVFEGDAASSTVGDGATLVFDSGGSLAGGTGCRSFSGSWSLDSGGQLVISELTSDDRACPQQLARQDQNVLETLAGRVSATVDGSRLTIMGPQGTGLGYVADQES